MKKKTINLLQWISFPLYALGGYVLARLLFQHSDSDLMRQPTGLLLLLLLVYFSLFLQIILHEGGHLFFGLLTGYRFLSFRIVSLMLLKTPEGLRFKRMSLAGTGGQCLLTPPELKNGTMPFVLYNLGGILANLLSALLCWGLSLLCGDHYLLWAVLVCQAVFGPVLALLNGLPVSGGPVNNDGQNTLELLQDQNAVWAFWAQLQINACSMKGIRLKDMPEEWFVLPEGSNPQSGLLSSIAVFSANRELDAGHFSRAVSEITHLLEGDRAIPEIYRNMLRSDLLFCSLIGQYEGADPDALLTKEQKRFMKTMKNSPSVLRTEYALVLLRDRDPEKAAEKKEAFEKAARRYPSPAEMESERELMAEADRIASELH